MSKNIVYYFTGTGNSLAIAKFVAGELPEGLAVPMLCKDALKYIDDETERIGVVYPVYMNAVPKVVKQFIETVQSMPSIYYFAVATHGGVPGMSGLYLNKIFRRRNISVALREAQVVLHESIGVIIKKEKTILQQIPKGIKRINYWLMNLLWYVSDHTKHKLDFLLE